MARPWARVRPRRLSFLLGGDDPENRIVEEIPAAGFGSRRHAVHVLCFRERLGCAARSWQNGMEKLRDGRLLGRFFATTRAKLRENAGRLGMRRPVNNVGYPV
jgi:hypothetical protein